MLYETIFNLFNSGILLFWLLLLVFPNKGFTQKVMAFPWIPLVISVGYIYFLSTTTGTFSSDFSSLTSLTKMFQNAEPRGVAAGWLHYLAFDFWVGCWMLKNSQKKCETPMDDIAFTFYFDVGPSWNFTLYLGTFDPKKIIY